MLHYKYIKEISFLGPEFSSIFVVRKQILLPRVNKPQEGSTDG